MSEYVVMAPDDVDLEPWPDGMHPVGRPNVAISGLVVRCRDCVHVDKLPRNGYGCKGPLMRERHDGRKIGHTVPPDGFCYWGVRREQDD